MKNTLLFGGACFVLGIALGVIQLWLLPWAPDVFVKIELTLGALFVIALVVWFVRREYRESKKQHTDHRLDD